MTWGLNTYTHKACGLIFALLICRLLILWLNPLGLHGDEAQYWTWAQSLDWGYFSKPPLIAWIIAATTHIFGDYEWAIRLSSPIIHSLTAWIIFLTARDLWDTKVAFFATLLFLLMPALWISSSIVSTDVALLLCWALALNGWLRLRRAPNLFAAIQLGIAIGIGCLAKYAMIFFPIALIISLFFDPTSRQIVRSRYIIWSGLISLLIISPNIYWNVNHDFATVSHTASNTNWQNGISLNLGEFLSFMGDQLAVFGPVPFVLFFIASLWVIRHTSHSHDKARSDHGKTRSDDEDNPLVLLTIFALTPLIIISLQALLSRANANWAATSYVSASLLTAYFFSHYQTRLKYWFWGGISAHTVISFVLILGTLIPSLGEIIGLSNSTKRLKAWPQTVEAIHAVYERGHDGQDFELITIDRRIIFYSLKYYDIEKTAPIKMWMYQSKPTNHAELTDPLAPTYGPVLLLQAHGDYTDEMRSDFDRLIPLPSIIIDLGGGKIREFSVWAGYGYTPTTER